MTNTLTTHQDCADFVHGCLFMGTGGGGDPDVGMAALVEALDDGIDLGWVHADDIDDDAVTATVYTSGSVAPTDEASVQDLIRSLRLDTATTMSDAMTRAVRELESHLGQPIAALVAVELGASNTPEPIVTAARLGIPIVDGDYTGRAAPEELQSTPFINDIASVPFSSVDTWGNVALVTNTPNAYMLERITKMLSIAGIHGTAVASTPLSGRDMKRILVPGTLSTCLAIGRAARKAVAAGTDPVTAALDAVGGWRLFDGVVTAKEWEDRDGYMYGTVDIEGIGASEGRHLRSWFKNENHVTWLDGEPWVCSPDLVTFVDPTTARGFTSTVIAEGDNVVAVGMRSPDVFRSPDALQRGCGPSYFGFADIAYRPIETLM